MAWTWFSVWKELKVRSARPYLLRDRLRIAIALACRIRKDSRRQTNELVGIAPVLR
jgi:hypothetical protein